MATLHDSLSETLDALSDLDRQRHALDLQGELDDPAESRAREELGLPPRPATEGERALREALRRDRRAVRLRYDRWFPEPAATDRIDDAIDDAQEAAAAAVLAAPGGEELGEEGLDQGDVDAVVVVLATVAEVVGELGGSTLGRCADAIDILERLLPDAQLSPARYHATSRCYPEAVRDALTAVHLATGVMDPALADSAR